MDLSMRKWAVMGLSLLSVAGLAGCGSSPSNTASGPAPVFSNTPTYGGTFTMNWKTDFPTLDPATWSDEQSMVAMSAIYDTLVEYATNSTQIVPGLAKSWTISPDGLTYTFNLRPGVKFSNGDPLTAYDVAYSLSRVVQPNFAAPYATAYSDIVGFNHIQALKTVAHPNSAPVMLSGISTPNSETVVIHLHTPQAYFLNELALMSGVILDPKVVAAYGKNYETHAVGTGPFKLAVWTHNVEMNLVDNPYYWGKKPYLKEIHFAIGPNSQLTLEQFQRGKVQVMADNGAGLSSANFLKVMETPSLKALYHKQPAVAVYYSFMNVNMKPFDNVLVRQAMNYAVSKKGLLQILNNRGQVATNGVLPQGMPGFDPTMKEPYPYNPAKAKKLLAEAGYPHGFTFTLTVPNDSTDIKWADYMQSEFSKVGVTAHVVPEAWPTFLTNASTPNTIQMGDIAWFQDYPDPEDWFNNLLIATGSGSNLTYAGSNNSFYNNPTVDALVQRADTMPVSQNAERYKLYDEAQSIVVKDAPWIFLYQPIQDMVISPKVGPSNIYLYLHPVKTIQWQDIWVSK